MRVRGTPARKTLISDRAPDGTARFVAHVGVDQCRVDVLVTKALLDCGDIVTRVAQMWKEGRPERVTADGLKQSGSGHRHVTLTVTSRSLATEGRDNLCHGEK